MRRSASSMSSMISASALGPGFFGLRGFGTLPPWGGRLLIARSYICSVRLQADRHLPRTAYQSRIATIKMRITRATLIRCVPATGRVSRGLIPVTAANAAIQAASISQRSQVMRRRPARSMPAVPPRSCSASLAAPSDVVSAFRRTVPSCSTGLQACLAPAPASLAANTDKRSPELRSSGPYPSAAAAINCWLQRRPHMACAAFD